MSWCIVVRSRAEKAALEREERKEVKEGREIDGGCG